MNGTIIQCRFETEKGEFNDNTKIYAYYVNCKPKECIIKEGTIFQVWDMANKVTGYSGARLRCENLIGVRDKIDAELIMNKSLKNIERIVIADEENVPVDERYINLQVQKRIESNILKERLRENKSTSFISGGNSMNTNVFGNMFKNMKFGRLETNDIKYSMKGITFKTTDGDYVCYNPDFTFTNVANMVIDMPMFAMPVSKEQIKTGDVINHNNTWVIVNEVTPTEIRVAKPWTKEIVSVIPETSIFGFSFYTKIMNPFENFDATATADNPFGNILPFMFMSGGDIKNSNDMLMMMFAFSDRKIDFNNPMMMYMLMGDKGNTNDMLMMMMLSGNNPFEQKHECKCGCKTNGIVHSSESTIDTVQ